MELVSKKSDITYTSKNGQEYHYTNYYLLLDNGRYVAIKPAFVKDYAVLSLLAKPIE